MSTLKNSSFVSVVSCIYTYNSNIHFVSHKRTIQREDMFCHLTSAAHNTNGSVDTMFLAPHCPRVSPLELETNLREVFTIMEKAPTSN